MHLVYGEMQCNVQATARRYVENFPNRRLPYHTTFTALHQKIRETESVIVKNNVTEEYEEDILIVIEANSEKSVRRLLMYISKYMKYFAYFHLKKLPCREMIFLPVSNFLVRCNIKNRNRLFSQILFCDETTFTNDRFLCQ